MLKKNLAYQWNRYYVATDDKIAAVTGKIAALNDDREAERISFATYLSELNTVKVQIELEDGDAFEAFKKNKGSDLGSSESETLIFSAGPTFEYSRTIAERDIVSFSRELGLGTTAELGQSLTLSTGFSFFGSGAEVAFWAGSATSISTGVSLGTEYESGQETEQTVGFVLHDDDIGDNISTRIFADPYWGTPLFFTDAGSVTSDPWEPGTNKAIDVEMTALEEPESSGLFDYHDGAHYKINVTYAGQRVLESATIDFLLYAPPFGNQKNLTVNFNGSAGPYVIALDRTAVSVPITVSVYPPAIDRENSGEQQYPVEIQVEGKEDYQVFRVLVLQPTFADLRAPRAIIVAPYEGERISPVFFPAEEPFKIEVISEDTDLASIQLQIRSKQSDGVWAPWQNLSGMLWEESAETSVVTVFDRLEREPPRREFTFKWTESAIRSLGVGEYALRAVATDKATRSDRPDFPGNVDLDPPSVVFIVDASPPTVLNTIPDYQARDSERIYRGELSATFTDDMRPTDFTDRTFEVTDLLEDNKRVAGFVSYSPALRKAVFVPQVPFTPNGFYGVEVKTDTENALGTTERGVHDLAGNPLDNALAWQFRTTDAPFEPTWSITLAATDGTATDANNIAGVEYGAFDEEDEKDVQAAPSPSASQLRMSFLNRQQVEFDRDIRPADGRLSHHWFFVIDNAADSSTVTIEWQPSLRLTRTDRQYQIIRLVEFDNSGDVTNTITLDPTEASVDPVIAYTYTTNQGENSRHFRLDVQKASLVASNFSAGTSGWKFFSVPITPQRADPFVNLGDDIDPFKLYSYDTELAGYRIYPLDLGQVSLQPGHGYFTRLSEDVEVDIGGASNLAEQTLTLEGAGWHAIGNPFVKAVDVANLSVDDQTFKDAAVSMIEGTLYRWTIGEGGEGGSDGYEAVTIGGELTPWEGYWLRTKSESLTLTLPVPSELDSSYIPTLPDSYDPPAKPLAATQKEGPLTPGEFDLRLALRTDFSSDLTTTLGTRSDAQMGWDFLDRSEPPTLGQTVAAYFEHGDWGEEAGLYNMDYQASLEVGERRTWRLTAFTDKPKAVMQLSWEDAIEQVPGEIMLYFRQIENSQLEWQDMREVRSVDLSSQSRITDLLFEVRAERQGISSLLEVEVVAGEKQVAIAWEASDNPLIEGYVIDRSRQGDGETRQFELLPTDTFMDTQVEEEATYTYQVTVRFNSGAQLQSMPHTVTVPPTIQKTVLLQSYPNPGNPAVWIPFELAAEAPVSIKIYNISGQLVRTLDLGVRARGRYLGANNAAYWDGRNQSGVPIASGVYVYMLQAGQSVDTRKLVLLW